MLIENKKLVKGCLFAFLLYVFIVGLFYYIAGEQLYYRATRSPIKSVEGNAATSEIVQGSVLEQTFLNEIDYFDGFTLRLATFARENEGNVIVRLIDVMSNEVMAEEFIDITGIQDSVFIPIDLQNTVEGKRGYWFKIQLTSNDCFEGNAVSPWYRSGVEMPGWNLSYNGQAISGVLCFDTWGRDVVWTGNHYWQIMFFVGVLIFVYLTGCIIRNKKGKITIITYSMGILTQYRFLIRQLVARDFKVKYKRSFLGMFWSFLNPLLTMSVQYMVFSTIFKSDINYYPVYLLSGIVLFNFFQESTNQALYSIVGNANLITKVYVPKYIYPVTKVLSSTINLVISLLPLLIMIIITGVPIKISYILLIYILVILLIFSIGIGFILSSALVFFRDVQFIWSVISLLWMYATPIFYPETIFPEQFSVILKMNPLYYFIKFARTVILDGISPEPIVYVQCLSFACISLIAGVFVFKKTQDKFILYV